MISPTDALILDFGWLPIRFDEVVGDLAITTLPDFAENVRGVIESEGVEGQWIYPPLKQQYVFAADTRTLPYPSRIFGLPKTHRLVHKSAHGKAHGDFLLWAMSFIFGLRMTATEAGFVDATPISPGKTTDFVLHSVGQVRALALAEGFWSANVDHPKRAVRLGAAIHALMLGQGPQLLQFEQFIYLYTALDACFAVAKDAYGQSKERLPHAQRIPWMCSLFEMPVPEWAQRRLDGTSVVADLRNATIHESLFMDAPLGFALHGIGGGPNLILEMKCLISRFLVALLGDPGADYVRSPTNTRQRYFWKPA